MILLGGPDRIVLMPFDASLGSLVAIWSFEAEALEIIRLRLQGAAAIRPQLGPRLRWAAPHTSRLGARWAVLQNHCYAGSIRCELPCCAAVSVVKHPISDQSFRIP